MKKSRQLKKLERKMSKSNTSQDWREAALRHDELSGMKRWCEVDQSSQYERVR